MSDEYTICEYCNKAFHPDRDAESGFPTTVTIGGYDCTYCDSCLAIKTRGLMRRCHGIWSVVIYPDDEDDTLPLVFRSTLEEVLAYPNARDVYVLLVPDHWDNAMPSVKRTRKGLDTAIRKGEFCEEAVPAWTIRDHTDSSALRRVVNGNFLETCRAIADASEADVGADQPAYYSPSVQNAGIDSGARFNATPAATILRARKLPELVAHGDPNFPAVLTNLICEYDDSKKFESKRNELSEAQKTLDKVKMEYDFLVHFMEQENIADGTLYVAEKWKKRDVIVDAAAESNKATRLYVEESNKATRLAKATAASATASASGSGSAGSISPTRVAQGKTLGAAKRQAAGSKRKEMAPQSASSSSSTTATTTPAPKQTAAHTLRRSKRSKRS